MNNLKSSEIAKYLYDFANLNFMILESNKQSIKSLFDYYIKNQNIEEPNEYFRTMINVYVMFLKMKTFCIIEEYNMKAKNNFVDNDNLNLVNKRNKIIDNDINLSDKKLLQEIRNLFCHSNSENELYKISNDGKSISFNLDDSNLKMNINDIIDLTNSIANATQNIQFTGYNYNKVSNIKKFLKNLVFNRYYFTKKVNVDDVDAMLELSTGDKHNEFLAYAEGLDDCHKKNLVLTNNQCNNIIEIIKSLIKNKIISKEEYKNKREELINILILKQLPLPISKINNYKMDSFLVYYLYTVDGFSYEDIYKILTTLIYNKEPEFSFEKYYMEEFNTDYDRLNFKISLSDINEKLIYPCMIFIEYVISNFCFNEEFITIEQTSIPYNKLRNSLVHARWVIKNNKIKFYDALPDIGNETEYNFECELDFVDLYKYCKDIMNNEIIKEKIYTKKA